MSDIDSTGTTTERAKAAPRYLRRRSDAGKFIPKANGQKANGRFAASFDHLATTTGSFSRPDKRRAGGDKAAAAATVALESRAVSTAAPVAWNVPDIPATVDVATTNLCPRCGAAGDDNRIQRLPGIVTLMFVVGSSLLMWAGIAAMVFAL